MTAELARSRGLDVESSLYSFVVLNESDMHTVEIDPRYHVILHGDDTSDDGSLWRQDIPGGELADILEAGLAELEGEVVEP